MLNCTPCCCLTTHFPFHPCKTFGKLRLCFLAHCRFIHFSMSHFIHCESKSALLHAEVVHFMKLCGSRPKPVVNRDRKETFSTSSLFHTLKITAASAEPFHHLAPLREQSSQNLETYRGFPAFLSSFLSYFVVEKNSWQ